MTNNTQAEAPAVRPAVRVSLCGHRAAGRHLLIDRDDWAAVEAELGVHWAVSEINGRDQVTSARVDALTAVRRAGAPKARRVVLSRWLARRLGIRRVTYKNDNSLDLRRRNLVSSSGGGRRREAVTVEPFEDCDE